MAGDISGAFMADGQEIYLSDIFAALGRRKRLILGVVVATTFIGLIYAIFATPLYTATVVIRPAEEANGRGGLGGGLSAAAAMAGINLGGGASDKEEYLAILRSRGLAEQFIRENALMPHLFPDAWDAEKDAWRESDGSGAILWMKSRLSGLIASLSGDEGYNEGPRESEPGPRMWDAYKVFNNSIRRVSEDLQTGIVTLSFEFRDPRLAAEWANAYVTMANREIRENAVQEATRALNYLNTEVDKTSVSGLRDTIYGLVQAQLEKITLANARPDYAFRVIDRAVVPEEKSRPKRSLIVILSFIFGSMLGITIALGREAWLGTFRDNEPTVRAGRLDVE